MVDKEIDKDKESSKQDNFEWSLNALKKQVSSKEKKEKNEEVSWDELQKLKDVVHANSDIKWSLDNLKDKVVSKERVESLDKKSKKEKSDIQYWWDLKKNEQIVSSTNQEVIIDTWQNQSNRDAAPEIAWSAKMLLEDVTKKDSNSIAEGFRKAAEWFLS